MRRRKQLASESKGRLNAFLKLFTYDNSRGGPLYCNTTGSSQAHSITRLRGPGPTKSTITGDGGVHDDTMHRYCTQRRGPQDALLT